MEREIASAQFDDSSQQPSRYLRGRPGTLSPERTRELALELLRKRREDIATHGSSAWTYRSIAEKVGVFSHVTISNWDKLDMSPDAILERSRLKAPKTKFTLDEERIICGWVIYQDLTLQSTTTGVFKEFVFNYFGQLLTPSFISKFLDRNYLSMKMVGNAKEKELTNRDEIIEESVSWLESLAGYIRHYNLSLDKIKVFDKTYLASSPWHRNIAHICPKGNAKSRKITPDRGTGTCILILLLSLTLSGGSMDNDCR